MAFCVHTRVSVEQGVVSEQIWAGLCPGPRELCAGTLEKPCTGCLGHQLLTVHLHSVGMLSRAVIVKITVKSSPVNLWIQLQ